MCAARSRTIDYLLIDISNSYTKLAFASRARIETPVRCLTSEVSSNFLRGILRQRKVRTLVVSSVVPRKNPQVVRAAGSLPVLFLHHGLDLGVGIEYPLPKSIGADRLANAAAVAELSGYPAIVVDFGTAVTFDVVSAGGDYIGGVIAPGLESMTNFLYQRTALLPKLDLREPKHAIGRTTREAMLSGAVYGYRGLVREILRRVSGEMSKKKPRIIATGGYAELIARELSEIDAVHPNLTLQGLRIIGNRNAGPPQKKR
jgi:type III pantothenate kinase